METRRLAEFQVVISVDFDDGRVYPLTENIPECLLTIANQKLICFQLNQLEKCGATEVFIVTPEDYKAQITSALADFSSETMFVELLAVEDREFQGSADCLRFVANRIRGEFLFMSSDLLCQFNIGELVNTHRTSASDITIAVYGVPIDEPEKKGGKRKVRVDDQDQEFMGITSTGRIMMKLPTLEVEEMLKITKPLLHRENFTLRTDLVDSGMYVCSRWIIDLVAQNEKFSNIRTDVIPFLIRCQFQPKEFFTQNIPSIFSRNRNLYVIDKWLVNQKLKEKQLVLQSLQNNNNVVNTSTTINTANTQQQTAVIKGRYRELSDFVLDELSLNDDSISHSSFNNTFSPISSKLLRMSSRNSGGHISSSTSGNITSITGSTSASSSKFAENNTKGIAAIASRMNAVDNEDDLLRCFAYVCEQSPNYVGGMIQRITTVQSYLALNRDVPLQQGIHAARVIGYQKREQTVMGESVELGEKVTYKQCSIGKKCVIGAKCKLNNCVIMDNVRIGDGCTIQNSVLCSGVVVENNCNINDCRVGQGVTVTIGSKIKDEDLSAA